ncbi:MAG: hypothetical protein RLZZ301_947 [Bacteroidota bacterium]
MAAKKKLLLITYYWPPSGGTGVQRWLHFARYLQELGWEPIVYTPSNPEAPVEDQSLMCFVPETMQVMHRPIWEPTQLYQQLLGKKGKKLQTGFLQENTSRRKRAIQRIALWMRANLFIPDAKMAWIRPSVRYLSEFLTAHPVDAIISTGPPHSNHLIAMALHQQFQTPWIADFRDPWTQIDWFDKLPLSSWGLRKHKRLEAAVFAQASALVVVSRDMQSQMKAMAKREVHLISNGFAPEDFAHFQQKADPNFTLLHTGSINADRNPHALWQSLGNYVRQQPDFASRLRIRLIGALDACVLESIEQAGLSAYTSCSAFMPHQEVIEALSCCSLLLLPLNNVKSQKGIVTGKLFEYLASNQAILAVGPSDGDAAHILKQQAGTYMVDFDSDVDWTQAISLSQAGIDRSATLAPYSRKVLAQEMAQLLTEVSKA